MPTASEEVRKPWHNKPVWVKLAPDVDRKSLGAILVVFNWALMPSLGDRAAEAYLIKRGFREHRFMWYRPKASHVEGWNLTKKEASAIDYLVDEWDHSYDFREYPVVLKAERKALIEHIDKIDMRPDRLEAIDRALTKYAGLSRALA